MQLEVSVPALLRGCVGGRMDLSVEADTLAGGIEALLEAYPLLRLHLYDDGGDLRPHVLLFYNEENTAGLERLDLPLQPGDSLVVLQNVSGG